MSLTITIPGAVDVTTGSTAPATLTIGVGVPGATGPQGQAGQGVPAGGTAGQYLQKIDGTNYNTDWVTLNLSGYLTTSAAAATYQTLAGMSSYLTTSAAASTYYPLSGNPSGFLTSSALTGYATQSYVASNYAPIAAGQPTAGTVGQVLTKNSGTNYDSSWQTIVPGDRYLTSSTTSLTINNANKTLTIGTGLSYTSQQDVIIAYDADHHMHARVTAYNSSTGVMDVDVISHTGTGTYASWTVNVGGTVPLASIVWGDITGTLGNQTDLATALSSKLESATAATTYAALAGATFTGEVITPASTTSNAGLTITPGTAPTSPTNGEIWATTSDLQIRLNGVTETIAEQSWVTSQGYLTSSALTPYALKAGTTFTGLVTTLASATGTAGFNIPHGTAPTTPVNGDLWTTTGGLFWRQNGTTYQAVNLSATQTISGSITFSNANQTLGNSTAAGTINVGTGATISGSTKAVNIGTAGASGSTTNVIIGSSVAGAGCNVTVNGVLTTTGSTQTINNSTAASTTNIATGATTTGLTKAVNIGTAGVAGSTTNIAIGSTTGTSTTTLQGSTVGSTLAADTNTTGLATTAFVVGQAGSATPLVNGTAAVGTSLRYARQDHVHPTDTSRAALASPTFTGTPAAPTAAVDTNTTQLATTAYVIGQGYLKSATASSTYAPLASPALTGTPTAPTASAGTNTTQIATTAFVLANAGGTFATSAQVQAGTSTTTNINPSTLMGILLQPEYRSFDMMVGNVTANTSGGGATTLHSLYQAVYTTAASGKSMQTMGVTGTYFQSRGKLETVVDWTKPIWIKTRSHFSSLGVAGQDTARFSFGKTSATWGDLSARGIGFKMGGGSTSNIFLMVHNGTTLTTVDSGVNAAALSGGTLSAFDVTLYSDGAGNVTLWIDDVQKATTTAGPSSGTSTAPRLCQEVENGGTFTTSINFVQSGTKTLIGV
jgi:hypothetical protein